MDIADGHPFEAQSDIRSTFLDVIVAVSFGLSDSKSDILAQVCHIRSTPIPVRPSDANAPIQFTRYPLDPELQAVVDLTRIIEVAFQFPFPKISHWLWKFKPHVKRAFETRNAMTRREVQASLVRLGQQEGAKKSPRCALDQMLIREEVSAKEAGRVPDYHSQMIADEV